jgi:hypothetical protein
MLSDRSRLDGSARNPFPTAMKEALLKASERFGSMLSRILLTGLYYLVLGPFALLYQLFADPLHLRRRPQGNWTAWTTKNDTLAAARRQD